MEEYKKTIAEQALKEGIINDPQWLDRLNESIPLWAVLEMMLKLIDRLDPPTQSYD